VLSGGRCSSGAKNRELVKRDLKNRTRIVPAGNLGSGSDTAENNRERGRMQRLANMANGIRGAMVLVQETAAAGKIQQRQANQRRADAPQRRSRRSWTKLLHLHV
jgi:hypothetical protein